MECSYIAVSGYYSSKGVVQLTRDRYMRCNHCTALIEDTWQGRLKFVNGVVQLMRDRYEIENFGISGLLRSLLVQFWGERARIRRPAAKCSQSTCDTLKTLAK